MVTDMRKLGFSLAEALITLMIVSLILAAVLPVMSKKQNTVDSMWRYASNNSDIYFGNNTSQSAIIGDSSVPNSSKGSKLVIATSEDKDGDTIQRSLIDFYQNTPNGLNNIGRIAFDDLSGNGPDSDPIKGGNFALGKNALINNKITSSTFLNYYPNVNSYEYYSGGSANSAVGYEALKNNTGGYGNTSSGYLSLTNNTTGRGNTAVGAGALRDNSTGKSNTALGYSALQTNTSGSNNVAIGPALSFNTTGVYNIAIGTSALWLNTTAVSPMSWASGISNTLGSYNIAIGDESLSQNRTGNFNIAIGGARTLWENTTGIHNTAIGFNSCDYITSGSGNVCLGNLSGPTSNVSNQLFIEASSSGARGTTPIAANQGTGSLIWGDFSNRLLRLNAVGGVTLNGNTNVLGTLATTSTLYTPTGTVSTSDKRLKNIIGDYNLGLEKILKLNIKEYKFKNSSKGGYDKRKHIGVVAQELQKIIPNAVVEGPGNDKYKSLLYIDQSEILFTCVNAIKQLYTKIVGINEIIKIQAVEIKNIKSENKQLKKQLTDLNNRLAAIEKNQKK